MVDQYQLSKSYGVLTSIGLPISKYRIPEKRSTMFGGVALGSSYAISYDGREENVVHKRSL